MNLADASPTTSSLALPMRLVAPARLHWWRTHSAAETGSLSGGTTDLE